MCEASSFDKLRTRPRPIECIDQHKVLILSLSKDEDRRAEFLPLYLNNSRGSQVAMPGTAMTSSNIAMLKRT
jgi:hypothetical protein